MRRNGRNTNSESIVLAFRWIIKLELEKYLKIEQRNLTVRYLRVQPETRNR